MFYVLPCSIFGNSRMRPHDHYCRRSCCLQNNCQGLCFMFYHVVFQAVLDFTHSPSHGSTILLHIWSLWFIFCHTLKQKMIRVYVLCLIWCILSVFPHYVVGSIIRMSECHKAISWVYVLCFISKVVWTDTCCFTYALYISMFYVL